LAPARGNRPVTAADDRCDATPLSILRRRAREGRAAPRATLGCLKPRAAWSHPTSRGSHIAASGQNTTSSTTHGTTTINGATIGTSVIIVATPAMTKTHRHGFVPAVDSEEMLLRLLQAIRDARVIP